MSKIEKIDIDLTGIGRALLNKRLAVPLYQRSYAWEDKHIIDLFNDIENAISQGESEYFLGSIVTTKNDTTRPEVADARVPLTKLKETCVARAFRPCLYRRSPKDKSNQWKLNPKKSKGRN